MKTDMTFDAVDKLEKALAEFLGFPCVILSSGTSVEDSTVYEMKVKVDKPPTPSGSLS